MKAISKLLTLLLVLVMVLTLIPNLARAEEAPAETETITAHIPFKVNPLYESIITEADLEIPEFPEHDPDEVQLNAGYYYTIDQAGAMIRSYMKARYETFTINVQASTSDYNALGDEMFAIAMAHTGISTEGDYLRWQYGGAEANVTRSYNSTTKMYEFTYEFAVPYYTTAEQEWEMNNAVNNLIYSLGLWTKDDYGKISALYDWICQNVTYDYENLEDTTYTRKHTAYAALIDKTAVCQGYALLFYRVMLEVGVDNRLIAGLAASGEAHGWNIVELDNLYYNVDSTWDAGRDDYEFFLCTEGTFYGHYRFMDYSTLDFLTTYPMSAMDYVQGQKSEPLYLLFAGECGDNAYWQIDMDRKLTIMGTGEVDDYYISFAEQMPPWHYWGEELCSVVVEEGITMLGDYLFRNHTNLSSVTLPNTLVSIHNYVFSGCEKLTSITIPNNVSYIGSRAFSGTGLTSITIHDSVQNLGPGCFEDCTKLQTVVLGKGLSKLDISTFHSCNSLTSITLPDSLTYIGESVFRECRSLKEIAIPDAVTTIKWNTFTDCSSLETIIFQGKIDLTRDRFLEPVSKSLKTIYFYGQAPIFYANAFSGLTLTCYYPKGGSTWTEDVRQQYNGTITWIPMDVLCPDHDYEAVVTPPTCQEKGFTTYTCRVCGDSYIGDHTNRLNHEYEPVVIDPTCEEPGYTISTCVNCGYTYKSKFTDPVDHSYEEGHCKWCGKAQAYAKIISYSTSLGGNIAMNFYVELSEDLVADPDAYIQFSFAGKTVKVPVSEGILSGTSYRFACPITSKNMTDEITAQVYNANGPVGDSKTMAVDTYCNWIIANTSDQKTINLMKAMLNYGASAQMLFNYRTDDLANAALADADKVFGKVDASAFAHSRVGEEDGIKPVSYTLLLDSETTVRCYFQLTGTKTIDEFTFMVDGEVVTPTYKDGYYYIEKANIAAHRLDDMHTFTCGNITITYGGMSYVNQVMTYYTSGTTFDMASALYAYSKAAEAYIG